jgi:hypothetical protein
MHRLHAVGSRVESVIVSPECSEGQIKPEQAIQQHGDGHEHPIFCDKFDMVSIAHCDADRPKDEKRGHEQSEIDPDTWFWILVHAANIRQFSVFLMRNHW